MTGQNGSTQSQRPSTRRDFLKHSAGAAALAGAASVNFSISSQAAEINSETLKVGLIGCGGRGTGAASQAINADKNVVLWAMGDAFDARLQSSLSTLRQQAPEKIAVAPERQFSGLDAFQKVLSTDVDLVCLATPPGFRPQHLRAAVEAGKHIFCEKPMATDAPGLRSVMESAKLAKQKDLALVAGFCWRYHYARRALYEKVHNGDLGDIRSIYATYYTGPVKPMPSDDKRQPGVSDLEWQLRNWYNFVWLSGDSLVEQAIHSVDKIAWAMKDVPPLKAVASGGRQLPNNSGNIYDHFNVQYEYAGGVRAHLGSRQISGCHNENNDYVYGSKASGFIARGRVYTEGGESDWRYSGANNNMYQTEHDELFASVRNGNPINDGEWMAKSTLMGLMGRMAAYTGKEVTWEEALNSQDQLVPDPMDWGMDLPIRPMALPGITKFA